MMMDGVISNDLYNVTCEGAIIGSLLLDNKLIIKTYNQKLVQKDFYIKEYAIMYSIAVELIKKNKPFDVIAIKSEFDKLEIDLDISSVTGLTIDVIPANIEYYIGEVKKLAYRRNAYLGAVELLETVKKAPVEDLKTTFEDFAKGLDVNNSINNLIQDASEIKRTDITSALYTGFNKLDKVTSGLVYGSLTILTGEPSSGKSTLLNQIVAYNLMNKHRAMIYSGELTGFNVFQWFMRTVANPINLKEMITSSGIKYYDVDPGGEDLIRKWVKDRLYIYNEEAVATITNLSNVIEYLARNKNVKLFVLDNMMTVENSGLEELEKQKCLAKRLKAIARKYKVCIVLVAHPRKRMQNEKKKWHMHDVAGASEVVNLADYELLLARDIRIDSGGNRTDETTLAVMKNRTTGVQGIKMNLTFDVNRKRFYTNNKELELDYKYAELDQLKFVEVAEVSEDVPF